MMNKNENSGKLQPQLADLKHYETTTDVSRAATEFKYPTRFPPRY